MTMRLLGAVMGHEQQVLKYLQQHLLKDHVKLVNATNGEHAAVTLQFHRMKQRLPADELAAVLAASAGVQDLSFRLNLCASKVLRALTCGPFAAGNAL